MQTRREDRSLGELFADLTREVGNLIRDEVALAKTEMTQKATRMGKDVGFLAVGGAVAYVGFLAILAAIILALALVLPSWLAAAIVGVVVAGPGGFLVMRGLADLKRENLAPEQTIQTLQEDATWATRQMS
jgi:uncharacterized protein (DUF2062 family)